MEETLKRAIEEYNSIFISPKEDYRIACEDVNDYTLDCLALDGIQLCAYCIFNMSQSEKKTTLFNQYQMIEWKCVRRVSNGEYIFYPWLKEDAGMNGVLESLKIDKCDRCSYADILAESECREDVKDFHSLKTCKADLDSEDIESVGLETDVIFSINRNGRSIEGLKKLCKILCCFKLEVMHSFFRSMINYIEVLEKKEEKEKFEKAVNDFYDEVIKLNEAMRKNDYGTFQEIRETSKEIADLMRIRKRSDKYILNELYGSEVSFQGKLSNFFVAQNSWKEGKGIAGFSCKDYLGKIKRLAKGGAD